MQMEAPRLGSLHLFYPKEQTVSIHAANGNRGSSLYLLQHYASVVATEAQRIGSTEGDVHLYRLVGHIVEVTLGVGLLVVYCGGTMPCFRAKAVAISSTPPAAPSM